MKTYEQHHKIIISHAAIKAGVQLSHKYITDRKLPDKAIDLIDEAAAKLNNMIPLRSGVLENEVLEPLTTENPYDESETQVNTMMRFSVVDEDKSHVIVTETVKLVLKEDKPPPLSIADTIEHNLHPIEVEKLVLTEEHIADIVSASTGI